MRKAGPVLLGLLVVAVLVLLPSFLLPGEEPPRAAAVPPKAKDAAAPAGLPRPGPAIPAAAPPTGAGPPEATAPEKGASPEGDLRIHGRVVDGRGTGLPGAEVEVRAWSGEEPNVKWTTLRASTGTDGEFAISTDRALASRGFGIETSVEGFLEGWVSLKLEDYDAERGVAVPVEQARAVTGRAVDEYARALPKTTVQLWYGSETTWPTKADADGRFRTPARGPRRAFELIVETEGFPRRVIPLPAAPADEVTDVGDVVLRRGGRLAGVVVDAAGHPVPGIPLCLAGITGNSPSTRSDDAGRFEFTDLGEGTVGVFVGSPGTAPDATGRQRTWSGGLGDVAVGRTDLKVTVAAETTVLLRYVDAATGNPVLVNRTDYVAWLSGTPEPEKPVRGSSSTSPYGSDRITLAPGARYDFLVRSPGFEDARVAGIEVPDVAEFTVDVPMRRAR